MRRLLSNGIGHTAVRYVISGVVASGTNLGLFSLFLYVARTPPIVASVVASFVAFWTSFLLQKYFTFRETRRISLWQLARYGGVFFWNIGAITLLFWLLLRTGVPALLGQLAAIAVTSFLSFFLYRFLVFEQARFAPTAQSGPVIVLRDEKTPDDPQPSAS